MIPLKDIKIGKADAINYYRGTNKDFFSKVYFNDENFQQIYSREIYFLLGDKGTGKTAFAVFSANDEKSSDQASSLKFTNETDFNKFVRLIESEKIKVSDFVIIWKVILLLIISQEIKSYVTDNLISKLLLLLKIDNAIKTYYEHAFTSEISNAIEVINKSELFLELIKAGSANQDKGSSSGTQINLLEIESQFLKALRNINVKKNFILFIDGTDQIPFDINRSRNLDCLRGLANAIWELNQFAFPTLLTDKTKYIKIVLLIRPDIFSLIRFHNANAKLKDNSVLLHWSTTDSKWKSSRIFKLVDNLLGSQQNSKFALGYCWNNYFDSEFNVTFGGKAINQPSFVSLLRRSFGRPRDILTFIDMLHKNAIMNGDSKITSQDFMDCQTEYSRYLLGEIKDQFNFFYTDEDWQCLIDFFKYFNGRFRFDYPYFLECYNRYIDDFPDNNPDFFNSSELLLQEIYSYNFLCYIEQANEEEFYHWNYLEKGFTNLNPLIDYESEYQFHLGLTRAIGIGKTIKRKG